jgi:hypothetical protein
MSIARAVGVSHADAGSGENRRRRRREARSNFGQNMVFFLERLLFV